MACGTQAHWVKWEPGTNGPMGLQHLPPNKKKTTPNNDKTKSLAQVQVSTRCLIYYCYLFVVFLCACLSQPCCFKSADDTAAWNYQTVN